MLCNKLAVTLALAAPFLGLASADVWLTFYNGADCTDQQGGVDYAASDNGGFSNSGPFLSWHTDSKAPSIDTFVLSQFETDSSSTIKYQHEFDPEGDSPCFSLQGLGFSTGPTGVAGDYAVTSYTVIRTGRFN